MAKCGRCGSAGLGWLGVRGGLCGRCRREHGPWIRRSVAEFYETLAQAEGSGPTRVRLGLCRSALAQLDKLEQYEARGVRTTREPAAKLRARLEACRTRLQEREVRSRPGEPTAPTSD